MLNYESAGFGYYAAYACPGLPWVKCDTVSGIVKYQFPYVSQEIKVMNRGSNPIKVAFTQTGFGSDHYLTVDHEQNFMVRAADFFVSGSGQDIELFVGMSIVSRLMMPVISGSWEEL